MARRIAAESGRRQADYAWTVLARDPSWGVNRGVNTDNPCKARRSTLSGIARDKFWTPEAEAAFLKIAPEHLHLALTLALWTGQRQGDCCGFPWSLMTDTHPVEAIQDRRGGPPSPRCAAKGGARSAARTMYGHHYPHVYGGRQAMDFGRISRVVAQGVPVRPAHSMSPSTTYAERPRPDWPSPDAPRPRSPRSPAIQLAGGKGNPRYPLPKARSGARRERDPKLEKGTKTPN